MKLSKQERIGAIIIIAIIILALGAFLLIKPKFEEVGRTQQTLSQKQSELAKAQERAKLKDGLRTEIEKEYKEGEHLADMFFPELSSYEVDNQFRAFLQQLDVPVVVEEITVEDPSTEELSVSFYTPTSVSYALKDYVNQGITKELTEEEQKQAARNAALREALKGTQTVGATRLTFRVSALSNADILRFVDELNNYYVAEEGADKSVRKAVSIPSLVLEYPEVSNFYDRLVKESKDEMSFEGRELMRNDGFDVKSEGSAPSENPGENEEDNKLLVPAVRTFSQTITFLSIERMQDPKPQLDAQDGKTAQ